MKISSGYKGDENLNLTVSFNQDCRSETEVADELAKQGVERIIIYMIIRYH